MTLADILSNGYGIDLSTLKFELRTDIDPEGLCTKEEVLKSITEDDIIIDGVWVEDFDIVPDKPNGYIELYWGEADLVNAVEAKCALMDC